MKEWRQGDLVAVAAILAGIAVGAWFLGPVTIRFGNRDHQAAIDARIAEVLGVEATLEGVPFRANSLGSGFSAQGDYTGTMVREADEIRVSVPEAVLRRLGNRPDDERVVAIRLGLAVETGSGSWQVIREGASHLIEQTIGEGEELRIQDLELVVPGITDEVLCGAWFVVVHELEYRDEGGLMQPAWTYAHSDRDSLAGLVGAAAACSAGGQPTQ